MRYLVCLIGGALLGALLAITIGNVLRERDAWPRAVMTVMQNELNRGRDLAHDQHCAATDTAPVATHLELMSSDIEPLLQPPGSHDRVFSQYASDLRDAIGGYKSAADCAAERAALTKISNACDACHRDYK